jgi:hypothetical protein
MTMMFRSVGAGVCAAAGLVIGGVDGGVLTEALPVDVK